MSQTEQIKTLITQDWGVCDFTDIQCCITKKSCTDVGYPTKKFNFWVSSHFKAILILVFGTPYSFS